MNENETNTISKMSIKVIGGGVYLKNKPQTITITWEIKDDNGNIITPDTLSVNNIPLDPTTTSKTYHRVFSDVDFTVRAVKDGVLAIGTTTARFVGPTQTVEDSLDSNSRSIAASANSVRLLNEKIENNSSFKGLFTSLDDLKKKLRSGNNGDWAIVGEGIPAPIYIWNKNGWEATGGQYTGSTIDLDSYYTKEGVADYTDDYNVSKNHSHIVKIYDIVNWQVVPRNPEAPVYQLGQSYDAGEVVNMTDDNDSSYECLQSTITAPYLSQEVRSFTLAEAISFLPEDLRVTGQKISFLSSELNAWMTYVFTGGDYTNPTYWEIFTNNIDPDTNQKIADLQAKDEDLQNQINEDVTNLNNHIAESDAKFEEIDNTLTEHEDRMDDIEDEILLSSVEAACAPKDVEILADRAYKDHLGNIIADEYITRDTLTEEIIDITNQQVTDLKPGSVQPEDLSEAVKQMIGCKKITNLPDEEDITVTEDNTLKFKDREYSPKDYSGMGKKILRKHYIDGVNTLTQHMINKPNTIYVIRYDYCLQGQTIEIPENCVLEFDGGSLRNGAIIFNHNKLIGEVKIFTDVEGTITNNFLYPEMFGAIGDGVTNDYHSISRMLKLKISKVTLGKNKTYKIDGAQYGLQLYNDLDFNLNGSEIKYCLIGSSEYTSSNTILDSHNSSNVKIHNGIISTDYESKQNLLVYVGGIACGSNSEIFDITFNNLRPEASFMSNDVDGSCHIAISNGGMNSITGDNIHNISIHNCVFNSIYDSFNIRIQGPWDSDNIDSSDIKEISDIHIYDCIFSKSIKSCVEIAGNFTHDVLVENCRVVECGTEAMDIDKNAYNCTIRNVIVERCIGSSEVPEVAPYGGFSIQSNPASENYFSHNNTIEGCTILYTKGNGIFVAGSKNFILRNNRIYSDKTGIDTNRIKKTNSDTVIYNNGIIENCIIDNTSDDDSSIDGYGINIYMTKNIDIIGCSITANFGIWVNLFYGEQLNISNNTIYHGNKAIQIGGVDGSEKYNINNNIFSKTLKNTTTLSQLLISNVGKISVCNNIFRKLDNTNGPDINIYILDNSSQCIIDSNLNCSTIRVEGLEGGNVENFSIINNLATSYTIVNINAKNFNNIFTESISSPVFGNNLINDVDKLVVYRGNSWKDDIGFPSSYDTYNTIMQPLKIVYYSELSPKFLFYATPNNWKDLVETKTNHAIGVLLPIPSGNLIIALTGVNELTNFSNSEVAGGGTTTINLSEAILDFKGKSNTLSQISKPECQNSASGIYYCNNYSNEFFKKGDWWCPSAGEMYYIYLYIDEINYILSLIPNALQLRKTGYLTSTEYNDSKIWYINSTNGFVGEGNKTSTIRAVRPVTNVH